MPGPSTALDLFRAWKEAELGLAAFFPPQILSREPCRKGSCQFLAKPYQNSVSCFAFYLHTQGLVKAAVDSNQH